MHGSTSGDFPCSVLVCGRAWVCSAGPSVRNVTEMELKRECNVGIPISDYNSGAPSGRATCMPTVIECNEPHWN